MKVIVTGEASFIGSVVIRHLFQQLDHTGINFDKLIYADNLESFKEMGGSPRYNFEQVDICDPLAV